MDIIVRNKPSSPVSDFVTWGMKDILIIAANVLRNTSVRAPVVKRALESSSWDSSINPVSIINTAIAIPINTRYAHNSL